MSNLPTGSLYSNAIIVSKNNIGYSSIKEAVESIHDSSANNVRDVVVYAGVYYEDSFEIPSYVNLVGDSGEAVIVPNDQNESLIIMHTQSHVEGLIIRCPTNGAGIEGHVDTSAGDAFVNNCVFKDGFRGIYCGTGGTVISISCQGRNLTGHYGFSEGLDSFVGAFQCFIFDCAGGLRCETNSGVGALFSTFIGCQRAITVNGGYAIVTDIMSVDSDVLIWLPSDGVIFAGPITSFNTITWEILQDATGGRGCCWRSYGPVEALVDGPLADHVERCRYLWAAWRTDDARPEGEWPSEYYCWRRHCQRG